MNVVQGFQASSAPRWRSFASIAPTSSTWASSVDHPSARAEYANDRDGAHVVGIGREFVAVVRRLGPRPGGRDAGSRESGVTRYPGRVETQFVDSDPNIMMGQPVIVGTRITVESILERLAAGESISDIVASHPRLTEASIRGALAFAAQALRAEVAYPIAG